LGGRKFIRPVKAEWWGAGHRCKKRSNKNLKNVKKRKERDKNKRKRL